MNTAQALQYLAVLLELPDAAGAKALIISIAQAAGLDTTSFVPGDPSERWLEIAARAMDAWGSVPTAAVRGAFLALATDPGDVDDFGVADQSSDQTPRAGFLSALGQGGFSTVRGGQTYATSFVTIRNDGPTTSDPFRAGDLIFDSSVAVREDGGRPSYISTADSSVYIGIGETLTLASLAEATIPVQAAQIGSYGNAALNGIDTCVTQSFGTFTVVSATRASGQDREARAAYIARCLRAADRLSPGGAVAGYLYAMNTDADGELLERFDGSGPVTITHAYVSPASATGQVTIYYGGPSGAVDATDVSSANGNIIGALIADPVSGEYHNAEPLGILPGCVSLLPLASDPNILPAGTAGGDSCINTPISVNYSVKIKSSAAGHATAGSYVTPWLTSHAYVVGQKVSNASKTYTCTVAGTSAASGGPTVSSGTVVDGTVTWSFSATGGAPTTFVLALMTGIADDLDAYCTSTGIGGLEQVAGAGVVYTSDLQDTVRDSSAGFYAASLTVPAASTTAITLGHIASAGSTDPLASTGTITGTIVVVAG